VVVVVVVVVEVVVVFVGIAGVFFVVSLLLFCSFVSIG
jgi:hypothetical protein